MLNIIGFNLVWNKNWLEFKCGCNKVNKPENQFNVNLFHNNIKENSNFVLMFDFPEILS